MLTAIILSGGKSRRMNTDKCLLPFNKRPLLINAVELSKQLADEIIISTNNSKYKKFGYKIVADQIGGIGPLGGLFSALQASDNELNIVLPCDVPLLNKDLFDFLLSKSENFEITVPIFNGNLQPLIGIYRKSVLKAIEQAIKHNSLKIRELLKSTKSQIVEINEDCDFFRQNMFLNVNTPSDYRKLLEYSK